MKKNCWSFLAVLLAALFVSVASVQAADISFGGQIIDRAEYVDKNEDGDAGDWKVGQRLRLNTTVKASDVTGFAQLQHVKTWGIAGNTWGAGTDNDEAVGVHQAHLTIPNLYGTGITAKLGRQEIVLDGHRLFGHTGWHLNAVVHDAAVLVHPATDIVYAYSVAVGENSDGNGVNSDMVAHVFRKGLSLAGGKTALYAVVADDGRDGDNVTWTTLGVRQAGKAAGYDYRFEYYHQGGTVIPLITDEGGSGTWVANNGADVDAFMFGARLGKKVGGTKVTLWYDYLSGNDNSDAENNDWGAFHTIADTGHKFYGLIDAFGNAAGSGSAYLGLQDYAIKTVTSIAPGWTLKVDYHYFLTAEDPGDNLTAWNGETTGTTSGSNNAEPDLGDEIDVTLKNKYNDNMSVQFGYSWLNGSQTFHDIGDSADNSAQHWAYAQVNFTY